MDKEKLTRLEELEKKYFKDIFNILKANLTFIEDKLTFINKHRKYWEKFLKLDNAIKTGAQETVRAIIFRNFDWEPFSLPICSDTSFITDNAIIQLDIKTVKNIDNDAKQGYLQVRPNQISYPNKPLNDIKWIPHQMPLFPLNDNGVPILSYFVKFIWKRLKNQDVEVIEVVLCCVPNGLLSEIYGEDLLINYKTYYYDELSETDNPAVNNKKIIKKWNSQGIEFIKLNDGKIWAKATKKVKKKKGWRIIIQGDTARFNIKKIVEPKLTKDWKRIRDIKTSLQNQTTLK